MYLNRTVEIYKILGLVTDVTEEKWSMPANSESTLGFKIAGVIRFKAPRRVPDKEIFVKHLFCVKQTEWNNADMCTALNVKIVSTVTENAPIDAVELVDKILQGTISELRRAKTNDKDVIMPNADIIVYKYQKLQYTQLIPLSTRLSDWMEFWRCFNVNTKCPEKPVMACPASSSSSSPLPLVDDAKKFQVYFALRAITQFNFYPECNDSGNFHISYIGLFKTDTPGMYLYGGGGETIPFDTHPFHAPLDIMSKSQSAIVKMVERNAPPALLDLAQLVFDGTLECASLERTLLSYRIRYRHSSEEFSSSHHTVNPDKLNRFNLEPLFDEVLLKFGMSSTSAKIVLKQRTGLVAGIYKFFPRSQS